MSTFCPRWSSGARWATDCHATSTLTAEKRSLSSSPTSELALASSIEFLRERIRGHDQATGEHVCEVSRLASLIGSMLGLPEFDIVWLGIAGSLHDVGKLAVPQAILTKPGRLTDEEWTILKRHPQVGADIVYGYPVLHRAIPGIRSHHERWDGQGYPDRLAGTAIPLIARVLAVADAFCVMTSTRAYQHARTEAEARRELRVCAGSQFDPAVVYAMERIPGL